MSTVLSRRAGGVCFWVLKSWQLCLSNKLVESISICKVESGPKSFKEPLTDDLLRRAKSATAVSLSQKTQQ